MGSLFYTPKTDRAKLSIRGIGFNKDSVQISRNIFETEIEIPGDIFNLIITVNNVDEEEDKRL